MIILITTLVALAIATYFFMQQPVFGENPSGARLERIKQSPHYKDKIFQNLKDTPVMDPDASMVKIMWQFFTKGNIDPITALPSVKTDLKSLPEDVPSLVWFGHSSYLIKTNGKVFLIDPVLSGNASPVSFIGKSFSGTDVYTVEDFPTLDGVIITHDHYDHLDYKTIVKLIPQTKNFYTTLGVGQHLTHWGVDENNITELDWWASTSLEDGFELIATPARHFSGRGFSRFKTLWASFVLKTPDQSIYIGGDSGYDDHFKTIGEKYGPFDIALLECGQYNKQWPLIHMMPEETAQASIDLKANVLMPVHWGKFTLANHPWSEPVTRVRKAADSLGVKMITPEIGQRVDLKTITQSDQVWWQ